MRLPIAVGVALASAARAGLIPAAPSTPNAYSYEPGDGQGVWGREEPTLADRATYLEFQAIAVAAGVAGLPQAKINMNHYLDNNGMDLWNDPNFLINEVPVFADTVRLKVESLAMPLLASLATSSGYKLFSTPWIPFGVTKEASWDWYYALGGLYYAVGGNVNVQRDWQTNTIISSVVEYRVYIWDKYNWDGDKSTTIGPFNFTDNEVGRLHVVGLAREYVVRGQSSIITVTNYDGITFPLPVVPGRS